MALCRDDYDEDDRHEPAQVVLGRVGKGAVHDHVAGQVVVYVRMVGASLVQRGVQVVGDLDHRGVEFVGQEEVDRHGTDTAVFGDQPAGRLDGVERNGFDVRKFSIAQRAGAVDERFNGQIIADCLAVGIVCQRIDATRVRRLPRRLGQLLYGTECLPGKHGAVPGCDGDQRLVGFGVGLFQRVEGNQLRVVLAEHHPIVVRRGNEASTAGHQQHDRRCQRHRRPPASQDQIDDTVESRRFRRRAHRRPFTIRSTRTYGRGSAFCNSVHPRRKRRSAGAG